MNYTRNILECFQGALTDTVERGLSWYAKLHGWCRWVASDYGIETKKVAGVFSALSPMMPLDRNIDVTIILLDGVLKDNIERENLRNLKIGLLGNVNKAYDIMHNGEQPEIHLGKWKTFNFYHNIMLPTSPEYVTIDTWAYRIAVNDLTATPSGLSGKRYTDMLNAYRIVAESIGILPHQLQAITWEHVRSPHKYQLKF